MRYKDYKKVDLPWLEEVPRHWDMKRAKFYIYSKKEINKDKKITNVLSLTLNGVIRNDAENPIGLSPSDYATYQIFNNNDLVFKLIDLNNIRTSRVGLVNELGIMSSAYIRGIIDNNILWPKYIYYWYYKLYLEEVYNKLGSGVRSTLSSSELLEMKLPIPPKEEQEQIARFLDWKINEIDRLISTREKQIKNLESARRILTIDKMLNNDYKGVMLGKCTYENKKKNTNSNQNLLSLSYGKIIRKDIHSTFGLLPEKFDKYQIVEKGNIVLRLTDLQNDHKSLRVGLAEEKGIITSAYIGLICNDIIIPEYLYYYLNAMDLRKDFYSMGAGVRQNLNYNELRKTNIKLPDKDTQKYIIDYLNENEIRIKKIIKSKEKQINNLKQLKQSLISDVVTGRFDIRKVDIPNYENVSDVVDEVILEDDFDKEE